MTETASLVIKVDSSGAAKATANLDKLDRAAGNSERATNKLGLAWGKFIGTLVSGYAVQSATRYFIRQADAMANMNAKLKLVTGSVEAATAAQRDLYDLSQKTSADLEATTELYVKLGQSSKDLAGNHALLLGITEKVSKALVISGADAASSAAVIRQFSQAMAAGALRGDEFISVMEGAPRLARAIADGMNVSVGSLRKLAAEGKLTSAAIIKALDDQGATLDREFGEMPLTVGRATQQVRNALTEMIGDTDNATEASRGLATHIADLARLLEADDTKRAFNSIVSGITSVTSALVTATVKTTEAISALREYFGLAEKRSTVMLKNQRDDLEGKLFAAERNKGSGNALLGQTMLPGVGPLLGAVGAMANAGDQERIDNLRSQIAEIDAIIDSREKKATEDYAKYRGLGPKFGLNVNPGGSAGAAPATAASAITTAISNQNKETEKALTLDEQWSVLQDEVYDPAYVEQQNKMATAWAGQGEAIEQATDKMSVFADQAARNIQSSLGDSLYEILGGKFDSIADRFSDMLKRISAEAAAAKIFEMLGGWASGYTGAGAGWINALGKAATAAAGGRAGGGPVMAGQSYWVGESGKAELFTPSQSGTISQGGNVTVKPIINVSIERGASRDDVQAKPNGSGGMDLLVKIKEQVERGIAGGIMDGSSPVGPAIKQRYGLRDAV